MRHAYPPTLRMAADHACAICPGADAKAHAGGRAVHCRKDIHRPFFGGNPCSEARLPRRRPPEAVPGRLSTCAVARQPPLRSGTDASTASSALSERARIRRTSSSSRFFSAVPAPVLRRPARVLLDDQVRLAPRLLPSRPVRLVGRARASRRSDSSSRRLDASDSSSSSLSARSARSRQTSSKLSAIPSAAVRRRLGEYPRNHVRRSSRCLISALPGCRRHNPTSSRECSITTASPSLARVAHGHGECSARGWFSNG